MLNSVKLDSRNFYTKIRIWPRSDRITRLNHILNHINNQFQTYNWMLTIRNLRLNLNHIRSPWKSGLIGVWYKNNLYLGTSTIGNGNPHPTNINLRTRSIKMTPRNQLFIDKSFQFFREPTENISPLTHNVMEQDVY
jgi:hypothetical protein